MNTHAVWWSTYCGSYHSASNFALRGRDGAPVKIVELRKRVEHEDAEQVRALNSIVLCDVEASNNNKIINIKRERESDDSEKKRTRLREKIHSSSERERERSEPTSAAPQKPAGDHAADTENQRAT